MNNNKAYGSAGEDIAEKYLRRRGWRILARNFTAIGGELDIVGYRFGRLVYFEVKTRPNDRFGRPADAVDGDKIKHMKRAIREFESMYVRGGLVPVFYPGGITLRRHIYRRGIDVIEVFLSHDGVLKELDHIKERERL